MKIKEKINLDMAGLINHGPITIVAFGDSITHGAMGFGEINYEDVYWNRLRKKINAKRNYVPVNIINAGIGGITAARSLERLDSQVLVHHPDLVIVCFGLNDVNGSLQEYICALRIIFTKIQESGSDLIFMTPNMLNTYVAEDTPGAHKEYAAKTARMQNEGKMDVYMEKAVELACELHVSVCDCYSKWKALNKTQDVVALLANRINHPTPEMHELFADSLMDIIFDNESIEAGGISTMYE